MLWFALLILYAIGVWQHWMYQRVLGAYNLCPWCAVVSCYLWPYMVIATNIGIFLRWLHDDLPEV